MQSAKPEMMNACGIAEYGGPEVLKPMQFPKPWPALADEVLVKIKCAALNPVDHKERSGHVFPVLTTLPLISGRDMSGVVEVVGPGVSKFKVGDEVYAQGKVTFEPRGTLAEYLVIQEKYLSLKPRNTSWEEAASLPLAAQTAWQACEAACLKPGSKVLIQAGAGGVGSLAIQMAKHHFGAYVYATASARNAAFVRSLGADEVIDYQHEKYEEKCKDLDAVLECMGEAYRARSLSVLKPSGIYIDLLPRPSDLTYGSAWGLPVAAATIAWRTLWGYVRGPYYRLVLVATSGEQLDRIRSLVEEGKVRPVVDRAYPFNEYQEAFRHVETGHARGKVVVQVFN